jgi:hypothetical protein
MVTRKYIEGRIKDHQKLITVDIGIIINATNCGDWRKVGDVVLTIHKHEGAISELNNILEHCDFIKRNHIKERK